MKIKNVTLVLIGAFLPDLIWIFMRPLVFLGFSEGQAYSYVLPVHTPFFILLLSLLIAILTEEPKQSLISVLFGSSVHLILDFIQKGNFIIPFYPLSLEYYSFGLFWEESVIGYVLTLISLFALLFAIKEPLQKINFKFRKEAILLIILILLIPFVTRDWVISDFFYYKISNNPEQWNNQNISLSNRIVSSVNPLVIDILDNRYLPAVTNLSLNNLDKGDRISFNGYLKDGKLHINSIHKHNDFLKTTFSFIGLALLVAIVIKPYFKNRIRLPIS